MIKRREFIETQLKLGLGFALLAIPKKGFGFDSIMKRITTYFLNFPLPSGHLIRAFILGSLIPMILLKQPKN